MRLPKKTKPYHLKDVKFGLVISVIAISIIGVMVIGSAKQAVQGRQIIGLVAGVILMIILSMIDYVWLLNFYWILYGINIIALVCVKLFGTNVNGAQRWIDIGVTNFQPSELSKILVVVFFAKFLMNHEDDLNSAATILKAVGLIAPTLILIVLQPDLSTTLSIALVFCAMMYLAGLSYRFIGTLIAILVPVTIILSVLLYSQISHFCTIISKSVFWHGWNRRNMQVMKLTSRIMQLWRLVPDSLPVKD